jgi:hypothetical protein
VFHLKKLKVLDGVSIEHGEQQQSKEVFHGRMTDELLESKVGSNQFHLIRELDISNCKLRDFEDMFDESKFPNL